MGVWQGGALLHCHGRCDAYVESLLRVGWLVCVGACVSLWHAGVPAALMPVVTCGCHRQSMWWGPGHLYRSGDALQLYGYGVFSRVPVAICVVDGTLDTRMWGLGGARWHVVPTLAAEQD